MATKFETMRVYYASDYFSKRRSAAVVLSVLADHANQDGTGITASTTTIALEANMDAANTRHIITQLAKDGILIKTGTKPTKTGRPINTYRLGLPDHIRDQVVADWEERGASLWRIKGCLDLQKQLQLEQARLAT